MGRFFVAGDSVYVVGCGAGVITSGPDAFGVYAVRLRYGKGSTFASVRRLIVDRLEHPAEPPEQSPPQLTTETEES